MKNVKLVDKAMERACHEGVIHQGEYDAWQTVKAELAQQTNNKAIAKLPSLEECLKLLESDMYQNDMYAGHRKAGATYMYEFIVRQLSQ